MSVEWLDSLESKIKEAARAIADLRRQNRTLKAKLRRLENGSKASAPSTSAERRQRDEIRRRVDRLAQRLEKLLDD